MLKLQGTQPIANIIGFDVNAQLFPSQKGLTSESVRSCIIAILFLGAV